jgi:hypothetical protein
VNDSGLGILRIEVLPDWCQLSAQQFKGKFRLVGLPIADKYSTGKRCFPSSLATLLQRLPKRQFPVRSRKAR